MVRHDRKPRRRASPKPKGNAPAAMIGHQASVIGALAKTLSVVTVKQYINADKQLLHRKHGNNYQSFST
ncbi:MAG: hypothetical protein H7267_10550 [Sandarakinorhabdus sp.]|nr:hypothetical protein [Sandarakinorhabdus sp.]